MGRKLFRIIIGVLIALVLLVATFAVAVRRPAFQTYLAQRFTTILSHSLHTKVSIERVQLSFFNNDDLVNFYMEDLDHHPMISVKELKIQLKVFDLFSKKINVSSILLDGGLLHMQQDSTGKKTNLSEVFKSFQSSKTETKTKSAPAEFTWDISLEELVVRNISFRYENDRTHLNLRADLPSGQIVMDNLDIAKKLVYIRSVILDSADISLNIMKGPKYEEDTTKKEPSPPDGFKITFDKFNLAHANFSLDDHNNDSILPKGMDFKHLKVADINLLAEAGIRNADTVSATITSFAAAERSGFTLKNLSAAIKFTPHDITLDNLNLKTTESDIHNYLSFHYNSLSDFKDFMTAIRIKARLTNTDFALKDLSYFVRGLDQFESNKFVVNGEIDGRVNNLKGRGIEVRTGRNTVFKGDFYSKGLPNLHEASLNLRVEKLSTSIDDLEKIYPYVQLPKNLRNLGVIDYTGSVDGFINDFVSKGQLTTAIGSATMDVNFKYDKEKNKASYKGSLSLDEFNVGKYIEDENLLGKISATAKVDGSGLSPESLNAKIEGNISSLTVMGYEYRDAKINGALLKKSFNGTLAVRDSFLDMDFIGTADLTQKTPQFNFEADVRKAVLKSLHLTKDNIQVAGLMKSDFKGDKIDNFIGSIKLNDVTISRDSLSAVIKNFEIEAKLLAGQGKAVALVSDFAEAEMSGNFNIKTLPKALWSFVKYTFTKNSNNAANDSIAEDFALDLRVFEPGNLPKILLPKLDGVHSSRLTCNFNSVDNKLDLTANIAEINYGGFDIKRVDLKTNSSKGVFDFYTSVDKVFNGDSVMLDSIVLASKTQGNDFRFDLHTSDAYGANYVNLTTYVTPLKHTTVVKLDTGDIKLGSNKWHFDPGDSIVIDGTKITSKNLAFRSAGQTILISAYLKNDTSTSLKFTLENTGISDFAKTFTTKTKDIDGQVNGKLIIEDIFNRPEVYGDLVINNFKLGKEVLGDINVDSRLDSAQKKVLVYASIKGVNNDVTARGYVSIDPDNPGLKIDVDAQKANLNFLNYSFFDKYVKNVRGYAVIKASVYGTLKKPLLGGDVLFVDDTVTVAFTNVTYKMHNQTAKLDEHGFEIGPITITDNNGHEAYGSGRINHESFKDFALDLHVTTQKPGQNFTKYPVQFLNTNEKLSPGFFGVAYGDGFIDFQGPINSPNITGIATTGLNTHCKLPINSSYETNHYSFYKFLSSAKDTLSSAKVRPRLNGVNFKLVLNVTPDARMDIVLDPVSGDQMTGYGTGTLTIELPKTGTATIYGHYEIDRGYYQFTMKNLVSKRFEMDKGGTIDFAGEVYKARLNLNAVYEIRTSLADLIDDLIVSGGSQVALAALSRVPVDLLLNLTGVLEKPTVAFDIRVIDPDPTIKSYVEQKLALLKTNETEMYKQVFGLLIMSKFIPSSSSAQGAIASSASGTAANTVSEFVSSQLSNYMSNLLEFANVRNLDVNLGFKQYDPTSLLVPGAVPSTANTANEVQLALSQRLLNNRLSISAGGNLDFGGTNADVTGVPATSKSVIPTGDFQIEYSLTPDGVWRAKAFNRTNYDYYNARNTNSTGIGIAYRREFDKISELLVKRPKLIKKKPKKQNESSPVTAPQSKGAN